MISTRYVVVWISIVLVVIIFIAGHKLYQLYNEEADSSNTELAVYDIWEKFIKPSDSELRNILSPMQFRVSQRDGTEPPFLNEYWDNQKPWIYVDRVSWEPLFSSLDKYKSWTWWPSFVKPISDEMVELKEDTSLGMSRVEVRSKIWDSHLWHLFEDWPADRWWKRYCMNSASMLFVPLEKMKELWYEEYTKFIASSQ